MFLIFDGVYCEVRYVYLQVMFGMLAYGLKKMQDFFLKKKWRFYICGKWHVRCKKSNLIFKKKLKLAPFTSDGNKKQM
jgi:hypothetical protein